MLRSPVTAQLQTIDLPPATPSETADHYLLCPSSAVLTGQSCDYCGRDISITCETPCLGVYNHYVHPTSSVPFLPSGRKAPGHGAQILAQNKLSQIFIYRLVMDYFCRHWSVLLSESHPCGLPHPSQSSPLTALIPALPHFQSIKNLLLH